MYRSEKSFMRDPATANCRIYVGGLDKSITSEILEEHFKTHGKVVGVVVQGNFGFIQFEDETSAQEAIKIEHSTMLQGRKLNVRPAFDNKNKAQPDEPTGNTGKNASDMPPRKIARRGSHSGRGRGGHMGMDRDMSPHRDERDYRYILCR